VRPNAAEREAINRVIFDGLFYGAFTADAVAYFQEAVVSMKKAGCDAVVFGCTETPLIVSHSNSPLRTLDSTRLLARAALRRAFGRASIGEGSHLSSADNPTRMVRIPRCSCNTGAQA